MIRIVQLSDLHVLPDDEEAERVLLDLVSRCRRLRPSLWLFTGDAYGRAVPYRPPPSARRILEAALVRMAEVAPVVALAGNHDDIPTLERWKDLGGAYPIAVIPGAGVDRIYTDDGSVDVYGYAYPRRAWLASDADAGARVDREVSDVVIGLLRSATHTIRQKEEEDPPDATLLLGHWLVAGGKASGGEILSAREPTIPRPEVLDVPADYLALGHLHAQQQVGPRCWYPGSAWATDFAETEEKAVILVDIGEPDGRPGFAGSPVRLLEDTVAPSGRRVHVFALPTAARRVVTLDYRWGLVDGVARWRAHPGSAADLVAGARVRARLSVAEDLATTCPWEEELATLRAAGAASVTAERRLETADRVRAPEVAAAEGPEEKLLRWMETQSIAITPAERAAALTALDELLSEPDEIVDATTDVVAVGAA